MNPQAVCPDARRLEALLGDRLPEPEQEALCAHLEVCEPCRRRLETLAASRPFASRAARNLALAPTRSPTALDRLLTRLANPSAAPPSLGHFEILEELGRGGMGVVYKARDLKLNRLVAIKVLAPALARQPRARQRFLREGEAAAAVRHDNVVLVHAALEIDDQPLLVLEYVSGGSLQQRLHSGKPLPLAEAVRLGAEVAAGLAAAHARGIIHRDVKPGNILLDADTGRAKLTDFGLAHLAQAARLTALGTVMGTPCYMAPEQARGKAVDARADLYSLGCVLYHLACGQPPFDAAKTVEALEQIGHVNPRPVRDVSPALPEWLGSVIDRLMAPEPADRFASAAEVEALLRAGAPPSRSSRRWFLAAGGATLLGLGAVAAFGVWNWPHEPPPLPNHEGPTSPHPPRPRDGVLVVIAPKDFFWVDFNAVRRLEESGKRVTVASTTTATAKPQPHGQGFPQPEVKPHKALADVRGDEFEALIFIGGWGVDEFVGGGAGAAAARDRIKEARSATPPVLVTALGTGPVILADADCFQDGVRATCWPYGKPPDRVPGTYIHLLEAKGAKWVNEPVVESDIFITSRAPEDTNKFVAALVARLNNPR